MRLSNPPLQFSGLFGSSSYFNSENGSVSANFAGVQQQRHSVRAGGSRNEFYSFASPIAGGPGFQVPFGIDVVEVADDAGLSRISYVEDSDATGSFQPQEGVSPAI